MAAHADDLRNWYSETLGVCEKVAAVTASAKKTVLALPNGRYLVQFINVVGAPLCWCRQGAFGTVAATKAPPSTPFDLALDPRASFTVMVRDGLDGLSFITSAGSVDVYITKISRGLS